jgi:hypothetical protein
VLCTPSSIVLVRLTLLAGVALPFVVVLDGLCLNTTLDNGLCQCFSLLPAVLLEAVLAGE